MNSKWFSSLQYGSFPLKCSQPQTMIQHGVEKWKRKGVVEHRL